MKNDTNIHEEIDRMLREGKAAIEEARAYLGSQGVHVDRSDWVRIEEYCKRFNVADEAVVFEWIKQGIIPETDTFIIPEYNNVLMIKAIPHFKLLSKV